MSGTASPPPASSSRPTGGARQVVLLAIVAVATLVLLLGLTGLGRSSPVGGASGSPSVATIPSSSATPVPSLEATPSASGSTEPGASGDPVTSATPVAVDPILVGAGDIGDCGTTDDAATADLLAGIAGTIFTAGDNAYESGTTEQFRDCFEPTWGRFKDRVRPAPGNHDWGTDDLTGYLGYFGEAAMGSGGTSWYAYDLGTWRVIVLDSNCDKVDGCDAASPQGRWLATELATDDARCTLAIWHHPRFSSGFHGNDRDVDPFWQSLYAAGVDVVVNGHDHDYERFAPQDPDGQEDRDRGIREFIVGTGGTELRAFEEPVANSELRVADRHGILQLTLRDGSYDWAFVPTRTDFRDRGTATCH